MTSRRLTIPKRLAWDGPSEGICVVVLCEKFLFAPKCSKLSCLRVFSGEAPFSEARGGFLTKRVRWFMVVLKVDVFSRGVWCVFESLCDLCLGNGLSLNVCCIDLLYNVNKSFYNLIYQWRDVKMIFLCICDTVKDMKSVLIFIEVIQIFIIYFCIRSIW